MRMPRGDVSKLLDDTNHTALGVQLWVVLLNIIAELILFVKEFFAFFL